MKKLFLSLAFVTGLFAISNAQIEKQNGMPPMHGQPGRERGMTMMKALNLTAAQKAQMKTIHQNFKKSMDELNKNEGQSLKDYRDKKDALHKQQKADIMAVLTPEQKQKAEQLKKERQAKMEQKANERLEKMKAHLGLTDEQVAQIKADRKDFHQKMMAIRENDQLSRTERDEQMKALKEQNKGGLKKYLTPEQLKKMEADRASGKKMMNQPHIQED